MSSEETPNSISYTPLKLLKAEVRTDHNGVSVVMEFIDNNGTTLRTPSMPYPDNFDPMKVEHVECRGDEIRIKNPDGDILLSVYAENIQYDNPIQTSIADGRLYIDPEEGEENLPLRTFSVEHAHASQVGWDTAMAEAFGQANQARQHLDNAIYEELNAREPQQARPTIGASAWFRAQQLEGIEMGAYPAYPANPVEECQNPKIKIDFDMKCTCCEGKIHYPDKLINLLGEEGTIKYFKFCKKTNTEPQLFCCSCFALMSNNSNIISAVNKMNVKIKKMMDLDEKEAVLEKREKELDEQLKAVKK